MNDRRTLTILFVTLFLSMVSFGIIIPNLAYYAEDLHASESQVDENACHADVGDRDRVADIEFVVADLAVQVVEECG